MILVKTRVKSIVMQLRIMVGQPRISFLESVYENNGYFDSVAHDRPVSKDGSPIPWLTYGAIAFLDGIDMSGYKFLEFGGGGSTLFWESKGASVEIHEDNPIWGEHLKTKISDKSMLVMHSPLTEKYDLDISGFDVVLIDGLQRVKIISEVILDLTKKKNVMSLNLPRIIIVDNSDWYPKAVKSLEDHLEFSRVDFKGVGPANKYEWTTTIFLNRNMPLRSVSENAVLKSNYLQINNSSTSIEDRKLDEFS